MDSTKQNVGKIVITALFAALACVATMIIKVPTVGTNGYVNIGDTIVLLSAWMIGGVYGAQQVSVQPFQILSAVTEVMYREHL